MIIDTTSTTATHSSRAEEEETLYPDLHWTKEAPTVEGWYFWCSTNLDSDDPFYWRPYYVTVFEGEIAFWETGTEINPESIPSNGYWWRME